MALQKVTDRNFEWVHGRVAVIVAEFNAEITDGLLAGLEAVFEQYPELKWEVFRVPGAFEIPLMAMQLATQEEDENWGVIVTLGCVVKGDTYHFELVANECARGCMDVMLQTGVPVVFEVLAPYTYEDGLKRSRGDHNHGKMAAQVALDWLQKLKSEEYGNV